MANELYHHGILGMKWGIRRYQNKDGTLTNAGKKHKYQSTGIKSAIARRQNEKVDKGFKDWKKNTENRDNAINLGKKANASRRTYEQNKTKENKKIYKSDKKEYKKALKTNTTYRKGVVRKEVGSDLSRKYLSDAKKIGKQMDSTTDNKEKRKLQKEYNKLMSQHDVERAKARRATKVSTNRMNKIRTIKSKRTKAITAVATTATVAAGAYAVNKYLNTKGKGVQINSENVAKTAKFVKDILGFIY